MKDITSYSIGLDIGTNSLGWSVADQDGELITYKKKPMCGTVLIQTEGQPASKRRSFRSARRRLSRKKQRIKWLQELMAPLVNEVDSHFFERLKYSYVSREDESVSIDPGILFDNDFYRNHAFHEAFPTVFHLRKTIVEADHKIDIRLLYLAIHHIIKYRGNFLYEGQSIGVKNLNIRESVHEMLLSLGMIEEDDDTTVVDLISTELNSQNRRGEKYDNINDILKDCVPDDIENKKAYAKSVAGLIMGYSSDIAVLFGLEEKKTVSFADENYIEAEELLDDVQVFQFESIQKVYSGQVLIGILSGSVSTISDAYIKVYDDHQNDLRKIKDLLRKYSDKKTYDKLINDVSDKAISYAKYIDTTRKCSNEALCKAIKSELQKMPQEDENVRECIAKIEDNIFLLKPRNSNNGAIPNQLHVEELAMILDNQSKYYPMLKEIRDKILAIASFRIPYYVGPLSKDSPFSWVVRSDEKITPWNLYDVVDTKATAQAFIRRMTNKCSYLINEDVLPKKSILFSEFTVYEELTNIEIDNRRLEPDCKKAAVEDLFKKHKSVSSKMFKEWYRTNYMKQGDKLPFISGLSDPSKFTSNMSSYIDMANILGDLESSEKMETAEKIIELITLFEDKAIRESEIRSVVPDATTSQIKALMRLTYMGWGRLSRKILKGLYSKDRNGFPVSILDIIKNTKFNFMQVIFNSEFGFEHLISEENKKSNSGTNSSLKDIVMGYPGSPALKKCTWVSVRVIEEIQSILGFAPTNVFIEVASGDEGKRRTSSRYKTLEKLYKKINDESFKEVFEELKKYSSNPKALDRKALALYFMQNGRCLYSDERLDINQLHLYQIDHILPRCYVKDDSFDNLALVMSKENQRKLDSLTLDDSIISKRKRKWESLLKNGLISQKKYSNLCRQSVDENDMEGFINRQLVETRQISTNVFNALKAAYEGKLQVYGVSAKLSYNLKQRIGLPKIRELNDFHHAVDAYTAILAGLFAQKRLSLPKSELNAFYRELIHAEGIERKARYGIIAELFCRPSSSWDGPKHQMDLINCAKRHDFYINCLTEEQTGDFYKQMLLGKDEHPENLIPRKADMPTKLYGGYTGEQDAYFCIVEDCSKPKKKAFAMVGIPIRIAAMQKQNSNAIVEYLKQTGISSPRIVKDKIKKYQHVLYSDGSTLDDYYLVGAKEVINAKQLWLSPRSVSCLDSLLHYDPERKNTVSDVQIEELYVELCERLAKYYPCYRAIGEGCLSHKDDFMALPRTEKVKHLENILIVAHANSKRVDKQNWKRVDVNGNSVEFNLPSSRLAKTLKPENIVFIDSSITGMRVRSYSLEL